VAEPAMLPFQARESVVFQIMQLVSAPFLAMATWYIVSPTTIAVAAGLAFGTGFASEPLLLMIRGMVEGIRPAATPKLTATGDGIRPATTDKPPTAGSVAITGLVVDSDQKPVKEASVSLHNAQRNDSRSATSDGSGRFEFPGVQPGNVTLTASGPSGRAQVSLAVTDQAPSMVRLVLGP